MPHPLLKEPDPFVHPLRGIEVISDRPVEPTSFSLGPWGGSDADSAGQQAIAKRAGGDADR